MNNRKKIIALVLASSLSATTFTQNYTQSWYTDRHKAIAALCSGIAVYCFIKAATLYKSNLREKQNDSCAKSPSFLAKKHFKVGIIAAFTAGLTYWQTR